MRRKGKVTLLPRTLAGDDENISQTCFWSKTEQPGIIHRYYPWAIQCLLILILGSDLSTIIYELIQSIRTSFL